jgi:hypothetical protein
VCPNLIWTPSVLSLQAGLVGLSHPLGLRGGAGAGSTRRRLRAAWHRSTTQQGGSIRPDPSRETAGLV